MVLGGKSAGGAVAGLSQNVVWLVLDRGFRFAAAFVVGVLVARHLGPGPSGVLTSGLALAALCGSALELGFDPILRRELAQRPDARSVLLGTATTLRFLAAPVAGAAFFALWFLHLADASTDALAWPLACTMLLPIALVFETWFHSQTQARYSVWAQNAALLASAAIRVILIATGASLAAFGWAAAIETLLAAVFLAFLYSRHGGTMAAWRFDPKTARSLLRDAWPFAVINLSTLLYTRIDVIMLATIRDESEAGIYGAAVRLTEIGFIAPMILASSLFPTLARLRTEDPAACAKRLQHLCTVVTWLGIITSAFLCISGPLIVHISYGEAFASASSVLAISAWSVVFVSQSVARGQWLLLENLQRYGLWYVLMGMFVNVALNAALIPRWGAIGAAIAGVITHAVVALVAPAFFAPTRPGVTLLLRAFVFRAAPASNNQA